MERFTKHSVLDVARSILDVAAALDPPLQLQKKFQDGSSVVVRSQKSVRKFYTWWEKQIYIFMDVRRVKKYPLPPKTIIYYNMQIAQNFVTPHSPSLWTSWMNDPLNGFYDHWTNKVHIDNLQNFFKNQKQKKVKRLMLVL